MFEANERIKNEIDILSNYNTESKVVFNDTPKGEIEFDNKHATNYTVSQTKGYTGTTGIQLLKDFNENNVNVYEEFFKEFSSLFMQIFLKRGTNKMLKNNEFLEADNFSAYTVTGKLEKNEKLYCCKCSSRSTR